MQAFCRVTDNVHVTVDAEPHPLARAMSSLAGSRRGVLTFDTHAPGICSSDINEAA